MNKSKELHFQLDLNTRLILEKGGSPQTIKKFISIFDQLYDSCKDDNYEWQYCPFTLYERNFEQHMKEYQTKHPDADELDLWWIELKRLNNFKRIKKDDNRIFKDSNRVLVFHLRGNLNEESELELDLLPEDLYKNIYYSTERKIEFLEKKVFPPPIKFIKSADGTYTTANNLKRMHIELEVKKKENMQHVQESSETFIDYSDNKISERIVMMKELGILDLIEKKMNENHLFSTNKMAEIISSFSGIKQNTLQSFLNPMRSPDADQSKSADTPKNIRNVREKLINMKLTR